MNPEQAHAFELVTSGKNVFITGSAGTGKSFTIEKIKQWCNSSDIKIGITSSTGISAINIQGKTLHSFLGIGIAKQTALTLYMRAKKYKSLILKLQTLKVLVIDEISMISAELFEKVSEYLQLVRKISSPFGGLQLVICGDLFQLPPVNGEFCFKSETWQRMQIEMCHLRQIIRQKDDQLFQQILENARVGKCTDEHLSILKAQKTQTFGEIRPTMLYSTNINVDAINLAEYEKLKSEEHVYDTQYSLHKGAQEWAATLNIPDKVRLKLDAQVMLTANICTDSGYANGTRCMVSGFTEDGPILLFKDGTQLIVTPWSIVDEETGMHVSYMPLKLAYALTIHKSQSLTLDAAVIDIGHRIFEYGQAYTALSRVRDLKSVRIININPGAFRAHPDVLEYFDVK
jgi:ATP-dependent DNA helicase PIF1